MADPVGAGPAGTGNAARIDLGDPHGVALTLNPFEPQTGFPAGTHASLLCDVWCATGLVPVGLRDVLTLGLLRAYEECGWDTATGLPLPGATIPSLGEFAGSSEVAMKDLHCDGATRALLRGFVGVRLGALCDQGLFFAGGHPLDTDALAAGNVEIVTGALDHAGRALVSGTLLLRLAERALRSPAGGGTRHVLAVDDGEALFGGALDGLTADAAGHGELVVLSRWRPPPEPAGRGNAAWPDLTSGTRVAACGRSCRESGPCTRYQIRTANRLAVDCEPLRLWVDAVVVAFVTGRPLPPPPEPARREWSALRPRLRECALATSVDAAVTARAAAVRDVYPPARLTAVAGRVVTAMLEGGPAPEMAGKCWVPPRLRWVHEASRVGWPGLPAGGRGSAGADEVAPPLDFAIDGLADWPGIRAGQRLAFLLRHPLSAELPRNRAVVERVLAVGTGLTG